MSRTIEQQKWLDMREYERQGKSHLCQVFKNCAVTMAGELVIGLTKIPSFGTIQRAILSAMVSA